MTEMVAALELDKNSRCELIAAALAHIFVALAEMAVASADMVAALAHISPASL